MQVSKWGDSLAIRLAKGFVDQLGLKARDEVNVVAASNDTLEVETRAAHRQRALDSLAARKWNVPERYRFDRGAANER